MLAAAGGPTRAGDTGDTGGADRDGPPEIGASSTTGPVDDSTISPDSTMPAPGGRRPGGRRPPLAGTGVAGGTRRGV
ncbi:hypothetical protein [Virgisporangium ochraceum]|uniref:hypothetical protein n=1 Tax=Virgisporangium ochraceum TaxID=65505 RepID=UPI0019433899|nr:hypothetical protein [Virgisporangium ochraceum]